MGQVEVDQVVAQQEVRSIRKIVQFGQCVGQAIAGRGEDQGSARVRAQPCEGADLAVSLTDFKVQREAMGMAEPVEGVRVRTGRRLCLESG